MVCDTNNTCLYHFNDFTVKDNIAESVVEWIQSNDKEIAIQNEREHQFYNNFINKQEEVYNKPNKLNK